MVKIDRSYPAPASLSEEKAKPNGTYSTEEVNIRLKEDFHNKCYICELGNLQDPEIEHLLHTKAEDTGTGCLIGRIFSGHARDATASKKHPFMMTVFWIAANRTRKSISSNALKMVKYRFASAKAMIIRLSKERFAF